MASGDTTNRFFTVSNILSLSRAVLVVPFVLLMFSDIPHARLYACLVVAIAIVTDKLDGVFARKFHEVTEWGKTLDPVADKIAVAAVAIVLLIKGELPMWFLTAVVLRDVLILAGGIYVKRRKGVLLASNELGKWTVGAIALVLFVILAELPPVYIDVSMFIATGMMIFSFISYAHRFAGVMKN